MVPVPPGAAAGRVMLVRLNVPEPQVAQARLDSIVRIACGLEPGELLAVRSTADLTRIGAWPPPGGPELRLVACSFAADDHELFLWSGPPEPAEPVFRPFDGGRAHDARALPPPLRLVTPVAAAARLAPGEAVVCLDVHPPLLLVDLLAGRALISDVRWTADGVLSRLVRASAREATGDGRSPSHPSDARRLETIR
jgi:hypothetical protein